MTEEQTKTDKPEADAVLPEPDPQKRERSTIQFPYNDLDDAVALAKDIHKHAGTSCTLDQLAAYADQSMTSGAFRLRVSNARIFGLTENQRKGVQLTELGRRITDPTKEDAARIDAFLQVPLYERIYEHYRGYTLPPAAALEKYMREIGVSSKQTGKARQAFMRSAKQAGFFAHGEDRLVRPSITPETKPIEPKISGEQQHEPKGGGKGGGGGEPPDLDPIIKGLLVRLPKSGSVWPERERDLWLELLKGSFELIYKKERDRASANSDEDEDIVKQLERAEIARIEAERAKDDEPTT